MLELTQDKCICALLGQDPEAAARQLAQTLCTSHGAINSASGFGNADLVNQHDQDRESKAKDEVSTTSAHNGKAWLQHASEIPILSQVELASANVDKGGSKLQSSSASPVEDLASHNQGAVPPPQPQAVLLQAKMDRLYETFSTTVHLTQPEYQLLKEQGVHAPLRDIFAALAKHNTGTQVLVRSALGATGIFAMPNAAALDLAHNGRSSSI